MNHSRGTLARCSWRAVIAAFVIFGPISYVTAQSISFYPTGDTLSLWGTCTPPGLVWHPLVDSSGFDRVVIHRYACEFIYGIPPNYILARFDSAYFTVRDSLHLNKYELWCTSLSTFYPGRDRVPPDTATLVLPGPYVLTLLVWRDSSLVDSSIVSGLSYQTGLDIDDAVCQVPEQAKLYQNYPNPFNGETTIAYDMPAPGHVQIHVVDMLGRIIQTLEHGYQVSGFHVLHWVPSNLSSGSYFVVLSVGEKQSVVQCQLMK